MDPTACWKRINDLFVDEDYEECFYACLDLQGWLNKGGFPPMGKTKAETYDLLDFTKKECKQLSIA